MKKLFYHSIPIHILWSLPILQTIYGLNKYPRHFPIYHALFLSRYSSYWIFHWWYTQVFSPQKLMMITCLHSTKFSLAWERVASQLIPAHVCSFVGLINKYKDMWSRRAHNLAHLTELCRFKTKFIWTGAIRVQFVGDGHKKRSPEALPCTAQLCQEAWSE